ncbi:MAG: hypothetical protein KME19_15485 [Microcoleus vaginatus WJT46-NPBG5]|jgi:hypothetical protein|nr:hypothetical protein [Microcoleus vaginatus WJT46-NPBG5]
MAKKAKGKRPIYLNDPQTDKLLTVILALAGEVSVLHERLDTLERVATTKGLIDLQEIETYQPDEQVAQEREQWRQAYLERVLRVVREELDTLNG